MRSDAGKNPKREFGARRRRDAGKAPASSVAERVLHESSSLLERWEGGITLDDLLDSLGKEDPEVMECKKIISSLLFTYFRHKEWIDLLARRFTRQETDKAIFRILVCTITQALFQTKIAPESAVNVAVDYARKRFKKGPSGFVNAVLRRALQKGREELEKGGEEISFPVPSLMRKRWEERFGSEQLAGILDKMRFAPPSCFRARANVPEALLAESGSQLLEDLPFSTPCRFYSCRDLGVLLKERLPEKGVIYIQDPATAFALSLVPEKAFSGAVLDACAAPGGKTLLMAERTSDKGAKILACDRSPRRVRRMEKNFSAAGLKVRTRVQDACKGELPQASFDLVLADVPCSNTGVGGRRPDAPWRFSLAILQEVCALQKNILESLAPLVKEGGFLLYSTCSIEEEEDSGQIRSFCETHKEFTLVKEALLLPEGAHDGAYAALLQRRENPL